MAEAQVKTSKLDDIVLFCLYLCHLVAMIEDFGWDDLSSESLKSNEGQNMPSKTNYDGSPFQKSTYFSAKWYILNTGTANIVVYVF